MGCYMPIVNGMNSDYINYFPLFDYVNKIKLSPAVLEHLEATNREFDNYMQILSKYDEEYIVILFILYIVNLCLVLELRMLTLMLKN